MSSEVTNRAIVDDRHGVESSLMRTLRCVSFAIWICAAAPKSRSLLIASYGIGVEQVEANSK
ncbi:hypothetical protein [Rhodopseudomonas sp. BR0M22]|uniref:hypothetical protein n=1 Tax=Rhodopseudomonas sp. BR0M22 TaxID=2269369 RepID=UPI0013DF8296|nr:hypothetical protein [Rhodopseudomonas sp. BR0M22]